MLQESSDKSNQYEQRVHFNVNLDLWIGAEMLKTRKIVEKRTNINSEEWREKKGPWNSESRRRPRQQFPQVQSDWTPRSQKAPFAKTGQIVCLQEEKIAFDKFEQNHQHFQMIFIFSSFYISNIFASIEFLFIHPMFLLKYNNWSLSGSLRHAYL